MPAKLAVIGSSGIQVLMFPGCFERGLNQNLADLPLIKDSEPHVAPRVDQVRIWGSTARAHRILSGLGQIESLSIFHGQPHHRVGD
jgi:hypothetical protein